jgi:hypothetical protein
LSRAARARASRRETAAAGLELVKRGVESMGRGEDGAGIDRDAHDTDEVEEFGLEVQATERIKVIREHLDPESMPIQILHRARRVPALDDAAAD